VVPDIYEAGEHVGVAACFGPAGAPVDPAEVRFELRPPGGRVLTLAYGESPAMTRLGPGSYQVIVAADEPGTWRWRFSAPGASDSEVGGTFEVFDLGGGGVGEGGGRG